MRASSAGRRRSDLPDFVQTNVDIDAVADGIFTRYSGAQAIVIEGIPSKATFFDPGYCPEFRVMKLAGELALSVNQRAVAAAHPPRGITPLRVTIREIMLAALLHDLGKQHEDCAPFIELMRGTDLRGDAAEEAARRADYLLGIVRDAHCRKGPCMIDRLRDAGRPELNNPFIVTVARRHGEDYATNRNERLGCWWCGDGVVRWRDTVISPLRLNDGRCGFDRQREGDRRIGLSDGDGLNDCRRRQGVGLRRRESIGRDRFQLRRRDRIRRQFDLQLLRQDGRFWRRG